MPHGVYIHFHAYALCSFVLLGFICFIFFKCGHCMHVIQSSLSQCFESWLINKILCSFELVHIYHVDLVQTFSFSGKEYILVFVDDFFRFTWISFLREKLETFQRFKYVAIFYKKRRCLVICLLLKLEQIMVLSMRILSF